MPLVELLSPDAEQDLEESCVVFGDRLRAACRFNNVSADLHSIAPGAVTRDGSPALEALCSYLRGVGVKFVPVFGFDHEPELWPRIAAIAQQEKRGLTFRLRFDDIEAQDESLEDILDRLDSAQIPASQTNLILDLGSLHDLDTEAISKYRDRTQEFIELAASTRNFAIISVVGSSMPRDVSEIPHDEMDTFRRKELSLWSDCYRALSGVSLAFGDYGVVHPNFSLKAPAPNANAKIRYTRGPDHHIFRGRSLKGNGGKQFHQLAQRLVKSPLFLHPEYSFGDDYVWKCSREEVGSGNLPVWVEVDMNHHLVYVADHLPRMMSMLQSGASTEAVLQAA